jgi:Flp pilus assembly protein TadD
MASADAKRKHRARGWMLAATAVAAVLLGACTLARNREYRSSLMLAETTLARWPTPAAHTVLGTELAAAGFMDRAEAHLRTAVAGHPPARYYLGTVLAAQDRADEALAVLQDYVKEQIPDLDQVLLARAVMGDLLMRRGRFREASEQYRLILAGAPQDNEARRQLAGALVRLQEYDEAISLYRTVLAERPDDFVSLGGLGVALAARGRFDEAIEAFRRAVAVNPRNSHAHQNLARALLGRGSIDEAEKEIQQALALAPDDPSARELQARIRAARK